MFSNIWHQYRYTAIHVHVKNHQAFYMCTQCPAFTGPNVNTDIGKFGSKTKSFATSVEIKALTTT